jgi:hypothetical protein
MYVKETWFDKQRFYLALWFTNTGSNDVISSAVNNISLNLFAPKKGNTIYLDHRSATGAQKISRLHML